MAPAPSNCGMANPSELKPSRDIAELLAIMARLRSPGGCPWDREQNFATIAPYTIEEAYEVAAAIQEQDWQALPGELGDLLLQVVFHARMAEEAGLFDFGDVVEAVTDKMIRRHPHVFGGTEVADSEGVISAWEAIKTNERRDKKKTGVLDDVPIALPALLRALKLQKRLSSVGFDWDSTPRVLEKLVEEAHEIAEAQEAGAPLSRIEDEIGDLLFVVVNLARHLNVDPENALRGTNAKVVRRFHFIETALAAKGQTPDQASLDEMEALWQAAKTKVG